MSAETPLTAEQLAKIHASLDTYQNCHGPGFACCSAHGPADAVPALLADNARLREELERQTGLAEQGARANRELSRLRARVAELERAAVQGRHALADLAADHDDPGTAALGALWLLSQATIGAALPADQAHEVLARRDAAVLAQAADDIEAACPEHGDEGREGCWARCHCPVADELLTAGDRISKSATKVTGAAARPSRAEVLNDAADRIAARAAQLNAEYLRADQVCDALRRLGTEPAPEEKPADTEAGEGRG